MADRGSVGTLELVISRRGVKPILKGGGGAVLLQEKEHPHLTSVRENLLVP